MLANLFDQLPSAADLAAQETFEELLGRPGVRIERIVSLGQCSPPGFWYCQPHGEWVVVLAGSAGLLLEGELHERVLRAGDFVNIPARRRHRVEWTDSFLPTIWMAVHYEDAAPSGQAVGPN
ncbi:cupin domain-containing protein [Trinickia terrae]|uniref:Cupin domain-containing protein n=2 Tax=Trinickia terrae TaxID=2571161 RepID=A0A4U1ICS6_9BURK|nr:cupin domain-containing protein [Trinickia terrae]